MEERYIRHIQLDEIGVEGQQKLSKARVLVVGAGGLGCPVLQYLAVSGIGKIGIVDHDVVSLSNLHRQILYTEQNVGSHKALCAKSSLQKLNEDAVIEAFPFQLTRTNYEEIFKDYDIIVDGTDNFATRYLISDACLLTEKPMVFASLYKFEGQVSVFNFKNGPTYRCLFPKPPKAHEVPNCNETGVLSAIPGIIGMFQAVETLKIILGLDSVLSGKMLYYNFLKHEQRIIAFDRNEEEIQSILKSGIPKVMDTVQCATKQLISLEELIEVKDVVWIDVREEGERPIIAGPNVLQIPLSNLQLQEVNFESHVKKIFFCQSGIRSQKAVQLANEQGILNCFSLREGASTLQNWMLKKV